MTFQLCSNDAWFGPVSECRALDFTLTFEASILLIVPSCLFLFIAVLRFSRLRRRPSVIQRPFDGLALAKAGVTLAVIASCATLLATILAELGRNAPHPFVAALVLEIVIAIPLTILSHVEHSKSPAPSDIILAYSFIKSVFFGAVLRTFHGIPGASSRVLASTTALVTSYGTLFLVELAEKRYLFQNEAKYQYTGEATGSILSRSAFVWLFPIMWRGRTSRLTVQTLSGVSPDDRAENARQPLVEALAALTPAEMMKDTMLLRATIKAYSGILFLPLVPRVLLLAATFAQPYLVDKTISFVQATTSSQHMKQEGWYLVAAFACVYGIITLLTAVFWQTVYSMTVRYRAAVVGALYAKALRLASHSSRKIGIGGASTYMSVDVERISEGLEFAHEFWASVLSIPVAIAILYTQAKWAAFAPLFVIAVILGSTIFLGGPIGRRQAAWLAATDKRIKLFSSIIGNIVPIKMSGYEGPLTQRVLGLREKEMAQMKSFLNIIVWTAAISNLAGAFCGIAVLSVYAALSTYSSPVVYPISVAKIFSILTTVNLLSGPLNTIGQGLPKILAAYASLQRIQTFLQMEEHSPAHTGIGLEKREKVSTNKSIEDFRMNEASFSWLPDSPVVLSDINLSLSPGKLHICIGPVASGKTTLLVSMLGETTLRSGALTSVKDRISYASQDSFVVVGSCRENIILGQRFEPERYDAVVQACALAADFARMPLGDQTVLSDKGITLSGGQRQRLALARAVYADAPLLLLDDVLSALDAETENHIFQSLFASHGLLKERTVVLATHNIHHLPNSDRVIVLEEGKIISHGTYNELVDSGYAISNAFTRVSSSEINTDGGGNKQMSGITDTSEEPNSLSKEQDIEDDEMIATTEKRGSQTYRFYIHQAGLFRVIICGMLVVLFIGLNLGMQGFLQEWSVSDGRNLGGWMAGYIAFGLASVLSGVVAYWSFSLMAIDGAINTHRAELEALMAAPVAFFFEKPAGRIVNRFSLDVFQLDMDWPAAVLDVLLTLTMLIGRIAFVYIATPWLALSAPVLGLVLGAVITFYLATSKQFQQLEAASKSPLYTIFSNTLGGLETIRAFHAQSHFLAQSDIAINRSQVPYYYRFAGLRFLRTFLALITGLIAVGIAALAVGLRHSTSAASLGVALSNLSSMTATLSHLMMSYSLSENGTVSIRRIQEIVKTEPELDPGADGVVIPSEKDVWPQHGSLGFEDVTFKYRNNLPLALKGVSFVVQGGKKIGICGRSGSGKSSTVLALFRAMDQSFVGGRILLDGVDIATIPLDLLRNSIGLVSQDPFLWHGSIREILDIYGTHPEQKLWEVLDRVGLKHAVSEMPDKLDTVIDDGGSLSRGQKQLICLARVLLRGSRVIVLDEATSRQVI
ncbi:P-loop containing nucleoside triphosphate hydrolase protein [Clavulina sp. PMI_390]|nr:P-loop containing nucleoside triphosphate hydrolase protein [Clavulina sp. PMI_390]